MDFKDDPDRVTRVTVLSIFTFIALVAVIFRSWARKIERNPWDLSDYLIVAGLVRGAPRRMLEKH